MAKPKLPFKQAFERYVEKLGNESGCWIWTGGWSGNGYGIFSPRRGFIIGAHRMAAVLAGEKVGEKDHVCHKCDTKCCVNPAHLFVGTHLDNMADRNQKDRHARGSRHGCAVLNESEVGEIRSDFREGETIASLSKRFKVSKVTIQQIVNNQKWTHV